MEFGILGVNKPSGMTSFDVVRAVKRITGIKKIGHGGTLDPMAEGVLLVLLGNATGLFDALLHLPKSYKTWIQLGTSTDTGDKEGCVVDHMPVGSYSLETIVMNTKSLTGKILQTPPKFSALKVNGTRAYQLAREGKEVAISPREVHVYSWDKIEYHPESQVISAVIECGSGTYIRSLGEDLARNLGTVGHLSFLQRISSGGITLDQTLSLDKLADSWREKMISSENALSFLPSLKWDGAFEHLYTGKPLKKEDFTSFPDSCGIHTLWFKDKIAALVFIENNKIVYSKNFSHLYQSLFL
ncbi:MAG: tRNA pseudouridine(55) synthase TruB [Brevinemataceae bacterium]